MGKNFSYDNLIGGLNTVQGVGTINSTPKKTESPDMVNVEFYKLGGIKTMEGNTQVGDIQDHAIIAGWEYIKGNSKYMLIGLSDGTVKELNNGRTEFTTLFKFPSNSNRMSFCNMNNGVVVTNGIDDMMFYEKGRHILLTGALDVTNGSDTVVGTSTTFGTDVIVGDYITIEGCAGKYRIKEIQNATKMKVDPVIDTSYTIHYYNFFNGADNYYCLSATPSVGDDVYDDNEQVISTVDYYQDTGNGEGAITFQIGGSDVLGYRRHVPSGSDTFNRDKDVTKTPATLSDKPFWLSELSQCNATLVNEDDPNVSTPIRGLAINFYDGRLFVGGGNGLYYAELGFCNRWDIKYGAGVIQSIYNDTSDIKALGLYGPYMLIHKEYYTYILSGSGGPDAWSISGYSSISCDSQQSYCQTQSMYFVYSKENMGIYPLVQRSVFSDKFLGKELSEKIKTLFNSVDANNLDKIFMVRHPSKRYLLTYMPNTFYAGSSLCPIFNFQTKTWLLRKLKQNVTIAFEFDNQVYIGTNDGKVLLEFSGDTFDGNIIESSWKSPWFEFGDGSIYKSFEEFYIQIPEDFTGKFYINVYRDGEGTKAQRLLTSDIYDVNALVWSGSVDDVTNTTAWDNNNWVKQNFATYRFPLEKAFFQNYQVEFASEEEGQSFTIMEFGFKRVEPEEAPW